MTLAIAIFGLVVLVLVLWAFLAAPAGTSLPEAAGKNRQSISSKAVNLWLAIIVLFFFAAALSFAAHSAYFILSGEKTEGRVVDLVKSGDSPALHPVFTYLDQSRIERTVTSKYSNSGYEIGDAVPVRYLPASSEKARIDNFTNQWASSLIFLIGGALMLGFLIGYSWIRERKIIYFRELGVVGAAVLVLLASIFLASYALAATCPR
ncbi:DUF3592 domain-containing protein [Desulfatibacillum aliphaticivorans]|uniref:DUF3592 domain-containing protein n=1 Tax=Desulfatibacillum aliphaticivorans TaxID=218208 RepID=UPI00048A11A4|nr:DUF3592 domain-containing protein [Desulfatibacillum aliphaticivorans]